MAKGSNLAHISEALGASVGDWYWVTDGKGKKKNGKPKKHLACIIHVGSNYYELKSPTRRYWRIHFDEFFTRCKPVKNPDRVIQRRIQKYKDRVLALMEEVNRITKRLGVAPQDQLADAPSDTQALAVASEGQSYGEYTQALVKAKEETLPKLFEHIRDANESLATWMTAQTIPLEAQVGSLSDFKKKIEDRIFAVELYAGLTEQVIKVADGVPAGMGEKLHLMQRRLYMDEECLAHYRAGGMDFDNLGEFDEWLAEPENRDRILPFPRCMVSFQVRRYTKKREAKDLMGFFAMAQMEEADRTTYLYVRNGEQIYCIGTDLDFGEKLFPDFDKQSLAEPMMGFVRSYGNVGRVIPKREYDAMKAEYKEELRQWREDLKERKKDPNYRPGPWNWKPEDPTRHYQPFNDSSVYYDDMAKAVAEDINQYNRIALIIQGLFDRSPILHPHPPVKTWDQEGFDSAIELIYDQDKALHPKDKPDFEAYMAELSEQIEEGSYVIGQYDIWLEKEREKERARRERNWRYSHRDEYVHDFWRPHGNDGPKYIAAIETLTKRSRKATFTWMRQRQVRSWQHGYDDIETKIAVPASKLFNVSAYKPGDYKRFLEDPRTRAEYLKWAPYLIAAEEFHAGNIDLKAGWKRKKKKRKKKSRKG